MKALLFLFGSMVLVFPVSCGPIENRNAFRSDVEETRTMNTASLIEKNRVQIKELARFPWNKPEGLRLIKTGRPVTSVLYNGENASTEAVIAPYRFRVSESGNEILILSNDPLYTSDYSSSLDFIVYDIERKTTRRTSIPMSNNRIEKSEVVDFLPGKNDKFYLLEHLQTKEKNIVNRLRYIETGGQPIWQSEARVVTENSQQKGSPFGKSKALLKELKDKIFLQTETSSKTSIFTIDSKTAKPEEWLSLDTIVPKIFINADLDLHYVTFIKEANNRAVVSYDPEKGEKETKYAPPEAYASLGFPAALDVDNNIYCGEGLSCSCVTPELFVKWTFSVSNIILDSGRLFTGHFDEAGKALLIYEWQSNGSAAETIKVPLDVPGLRLGRLAGLVNAEDFVIETYQQENKTLRVYSAKSKTLTTLPETSPFSRFQLQGAASWQVDKAGNLYLPVSSAEGFHIIKVSIAK